MVLINIAKQLLGKFVLLHTLISWMTVTIFMYELLLSFQDTIMFLLSA